MPIRVELEQVLKRREWSMWKLSQVTGVTPSAVWRLVRHKTTSINFPTLAAICEALECEPGDVLKLEKGKKRKSTP